mgnify:CR=1 FL=1
MKKKIITTLIFALTITLTACSAGQTEAPARAESPVSTQTENSSDSAGDVTMIQSYMGQVSDKVGNDITVSLGELVLDSGDGSGETYYVGENGESRPMDGGDSGNAGDITIMIPAPNDAAGERTEGNTGDIPAEQLPIEFTGEVLEFTIPAGAKITNALGKEISFDNVTKGSLVQIIVNETTGVVEHLMVM